MAATEKKDAPENGKGDKGHEREEKEQDRADHTPGQKDHEGRGGHRKQTSGNPDAAND